MSSASCSKDKEESSSVAETTIATTEQTTETTTVTTDAPEKPKKKISTGSTNVLTGKQDISKKAKGKRPVAIMVNNINESLPQYGLYKADMLFECPVEGGITRLMALYGDYTKVPKVMSVRSCRYYFALFANSFDAIYLHWGIDEKIAHNMLDKLKIDHIDGKINETLFKRDAQRLATYDMEHSGYCDGKLIPSQVKKAGIRTKIKSGVGSTAFNFFSSPTAVSKTKCKSVHIDFSFAYSSDFNYNSKTRTYKKLRNGQKHIDASNNKQLEYTNVVALETKSVNVVDQVSGLLTLDWKGGNGYVFSNGTVRKIKWKKSSELGKIKLYDEKGNIVKLNKGKTYVGVTPVNTISYK